MQHETLSVNFHADPFDITIHFGRIYVYRDHIPLHCLIVIRLEEGVVVKVAEVPDIS
jgi:hypothetical protein